MNTIKTVPALWKMILCGIVLCVISGNALAADNSLTEEEKEAGWQLLFNGESLDGWKNNNGKPLPKHVLEEGAINPHEAGGYLVVYDKEFSDFILKCDVKMGAPSCNSGVFVRVSDLSDPIYYGLEVQILSGTGSGMHDFGAIYDLVAPSKNASKGIGQWDQLEIHCEGPIIRVKVNGEVVTEIDCDEFAERGLRPDGTEHKFRRAIKDFARKGYIGLQDHGDNVWYKNIKLKELNK